MVLDTVGAILFVVLLYIVIRREHAKSPIGRAEQREAERGATRRRAD